MTIKQYCQATSDNFGPMQYFRQSRAIKARLVSIQDLVRHSHLQVTNGFARSVCAIAKCIVYESASDTTDPFERELAQGFRKSRWGRLRKDLFVRITFSYCQVGWSSTSVLSSPRENYWKQEVCSRNQTNQKLLLNRHYYERASIDGRCRVKPIIMKQKSGSGVEFSVQLYFRKTAYGGNKISKKFRSTVLVDIHKIWI